MIRTAAIGFDDDGMLVWFLEEKEVKSLVYIIVNSTSPQTGPLAILP
jgi:hypothetical protein